MIEMYEEEMIQQLIEDNAWYHMNWTEDKHQPLAEQLYAQMTGWA